MGTDVNKQTIPVIGGHAGTTIVPLLSQVQSHKQAAGVSHTARRKGLLGQTGRVRARLRLTGSATVLW